MLNGQVVGIGENVGGDAAPAQARMQFNHRGDGREDVRKKNPEFFEPPQKTRGLTDGLEKLLSRQAPRFISDEQRRAAEKRVQVFRRPRAAGRNPASSDRIVKIHQDLAEIEGDYGWAHSISLRPSSARLRVSSSANSRPLPAGRP